MIRVITISDLHGNLPKIDDSADIMIIAGDISPLNIQGFDNLMKEWIYDEFISWINDLNVEKVFLVAGNHDFFFRKIKKKELDKLQSITNSKLIYLENTTIEYIDKNKEVWTIFGTPYCHKFGNWPFMISDELLAEKFKEIPNKIDIIISHDPPYGVGLHDCSLQNPYSSAVGPLHLGNKPLRNRISEIDFGILIAGHIHSGDKNITEFGKGRVVNVSILDEHYNLNYPALIMEIEKHDGHISCINSSSYDIKGIFKSTN